jgi:hypothetical protein
VILFPTAKSVRLDLIHTSVLGVNQIGRQHDFGYSERSVDEIVMVHDFGYERILLQLMYKQHNFGIVFRLSDLT